MTKKLKSDFSEAVILIQNSFSMITDDEKLSSNEITSIERSIDELKADTIQTFYSFDHIAEYLKNDKTNQSIDPSYTIFIGLGAIGAAFISKKTPEWFIGISDDFSKNIKDIDAKIRGRILQAISKIVKAPLKSQGNTIKPLTGEKKGLWRYRVGDYRIIYQPDLSTKHILLLAFGPRGSVYA